MLRLLFVIASVIASTTAIDTAVLRWIDARGRRRVHERIVGATGGVPANPRWVELVLGRSTGTTSTRMGVMIGRVAAVLDATVYRSTALEEAQRMAGLSNAFDRFTFARGVGRSMAIGAITGIVAGWATGMLVPAVIACSSAGALVPAHLLRKTSQRRIATIAAELPQMVDLISLGLSAGLTFDRALELYTGRTRGPLADELDEAERLARLRGIPRETALLRVAQDSGSAAFARFASSVSQAVRLGTPLVAALDTQASDARASHRASVEERIARAPIRMIVPLGIFILPAMILIVIGPMAASFFGR